MEYRSQTYTINNQEIHTVETGKPNRQVALMIHGWSSSWYALSPLMGLLSQRFRCVAVDLPGYGKSPPFPQRTTIPNYAEILTDLVEEISDGPVVLVGHSMGGMTSLSMALLYPAVVERMVLISPTISGRLSTRINISIAPITLMERFGLGSLIVSSIERLVVGVTDHLMRPISFAERTGITEDDYHQLRADARRPGQGRVRAECYFAMRENNLSGKIGAIETPTLILWGAEDNTVPLRDAGIVADEWPQADLRIIPKAGHWAHFETPDTVRQRVAAFLGLPLLSDQLFTPVADEELARVQEVARFLANSDLGQELDHNHRIRLAAQLRQRVYEPYTSIVSAKDEGNEMYLVQDGTVEVWSDPDNPGELPMQPQRAAILKPGQIVGELAMIDQGARSADLISGPEGATVLALSRKRLLALLEDDPELGTRLMWQMARAMSQRVRFVLWQLQRANRRFREREKEHDKI